MDRNIVRSELLHLKFNADDVAKWLLLPGNEHYVPRTAKSCAVVQQVGDAVIVRWYTGESWNGQRCYVGWKVTESVAGPMWDYKLIEGDTLTVESHWGHGLVSEDFFRAYGGYVSGSFHNFSNGEDWVNAPADFLEYVNSIGVTPSELLQIMVQIELINREPWSAPRVLAATL